MDAKASDTPQKKGFYGMGYAENPPAPVLELYVLAIDHSKPFVFRSGLLFFPPAVTDLVEKVY